jgi:pyruvate/2-oxoglutarate dehydrogenase complex dihydrolipoamide dehydrogenase (E3) component
MNMPQAERFEYLVLGSGNGGMILAWHLAQAGRRVAVVERRYIGGSCHNINCLPSKNEIWSAKVADLAKHGARFGTITGPVRIDVGRVRQRKRDMVEALKELTIKLYRTSGANIIMGEGRFVAPKTLDVRLNEGGTRTLVGDQVFLNLGTHATVPNVPGLEATKPLTNIEALDLDYAPSHLIVLGGGFVGLELAQAYRRFGSRVTIIHRGPQIAEREDPDVAAEMHRILTDEGVDVLVGAQPLQVRGRSGQGVSVVVHTSSGERSVDGSDLLVAAGRTPNTAGIGLDVAGVELDERGYIKVNERLQTTAPDVWAIGESAGSPQFTHVSFDDFRVIRDNLARLDHTTHGRLVPYCVFTDPPLARVGLSETDARRRGIATRVAKLPMNQVLRTFTLDEQQGFMKALVAEHDDEILGFAMIGPEAGEVMAVVQTAMLGHLPYTKLRDAILAHPTMAEGLNGLFANVPPRRATSTVVTG